MLAELLTTSAFTFLLLFVRVGAAIMVLPGFGENYVPPTVRLAVALAITLALAPILTPLLPAQPPGPMPLFLLIAGEIGVGVVIGGIARLIMSALHVAGTVISFNSSLAYALMIDPAQGVQGALIASFLSFLGVVLIFALDLHYMLLAAIADSYVLFVPGSLPPIADFADLALRVVGGAFALGLQLAAPFFVYAMVVNLGIGILARLMPTLPIFFIVIPLQIWFAFLLLGVVLAGVMQFHAAYFEDQMSNLLVRG